MRRQPHVPTVPRVLAPADVLEYFAENLARARAAAPDAPDLLVPASARTLFVPTEPFLTESYLRLPVGRQRMEIIHISGHRAVGEALRARAENGPLTQSFEPRPARLVRRRIGIGHVNKGGPWMYDEPALRDVRRLISAPFKPAAAAALRERARTMSEAVLADMLSVDADELDVGVLANEVHFRMMAHVMGVREELAQRFREWMRVFNDSASLAALKWQPGIRRTLSALVRRAEHARRAGRPVPGLLGALAGERLAGAELGGSPLRRSDVVSLLWAVIAAGTDTPGTAATAAVFFTVQTGQFRDLAEPDRARAALAEGLRFYPPFPKPMMQVRRDCSIGGTELRKDQWVEVHLPAANRDEAWFSRPHEFDPDRADAKNARPFGDVPHYCIGSHYGSMVGAEVVSTLAAAVPGLSLVADRSRYRRHAGLLHRLDSLPMRTNRP